MKIIWNDNDNIINENNIILLIMILLINKY